MLDNVSSMFENMYTLIKRMRKSEYERNVKSYQEKYNAFFSEMIEYMDAAEDKTNAAEEIGQIFAEEMYVNCVGKKKLSLQVSMDLNLMMIYYIFPIILLTRNDNAEILADAMRDKWNERFKSKIDYASYETIRDGFPSKMFGIF